MSSKESPEIPIELLSGGVLVEINKPPLEETVHELGIMAYEYYKEQDLASGWTNQTLRSLDLACDVIRNGYNGQLVVTRVLRVVNPLINETSRIITSTNGKTNSKTGKKPSINGMLFRADYEPTIGTRKYLGGAAYIAAGKIGNIFAVKAVHPRDASGVPIDLSADNVIFPYDSYTADFSSCPNSKIQEYLNRAKRIGGTTREGAKRSTTLTTGRMVSKRTSGMRT